MPSTKLPSAVLRWTNWLAAHDYVRSPRALSALLPGADVATSPRYFCILPPNPFGPVEDLWEFLKTLDAEPGCPQIRAEREHTLEIIARRKARAH